jgi:hypothetical protein
MILRPLLLIFGLPLLHVVLRATPLGPDFGYVMMGMTTIFLAWLAIAAVSAVITILAALHGDGRRAASWGVVPLVIGFGAVHHNYVRAYTNLAGDALNFAVRLPPGQQSPAWKERAERNELGCGSFYVTPLVGHFYLAEFPC